MSEAEALLCLAASVTIGFLCGWGFGFAAGDSKPRIRKSILVGMGSAIAGWAFGLALPITEYKWFGVICLALISSLYGGHIYWAIFKAKSKIVKELDANPDSNRIRNVERPSTP